MKKISKEQLTPGAWDNQAQIWAQEVRAGKDVFRDLYNNPAFLAFIGTIKGKRILDAGCGEGYNTRIFAKHGAKITGADLSETMIHLAKEEENRHPLGIEYQVASFADLSIFKSESFDMVLSTMALMDSPAYEQAIKEFYRVLKPTGELFFSIIHPCFLTPHYKNMCDEHGNVKRMVGSYFKEEPWEFSWSLAKEVDKSDVQQFTATSYHRTLSTYINTLLNTGFVLKKIGEPRSSEQACKQNPRLQVAHDVVPTFLYVHAIKL